MRSLPPLDKDAKTAEYIAPSRCLAGNVTDYSPAIYFYGKASRELSYLGWLTIPTNIYDAMIPVPF